ncbi:MAG: hypothetical protein EHM89_01425 [Acidobacteria bacterium]|jgi:hypothetical protein|nr:MAG: hypothetical protein EHM89_01425 [Acidobacteriota bacterium]
MRIAGLQNCRIAERIAPILVVALALGLAIGQARSDAAAQQPGQAPAPPRTARTNAPIDLTGTWVSVVTEDWRHRMTTARKGDFESLPLNPEGRRVANTWDLASDNAASLQCKAFGIGGIMRQPGRLRVSWQDDNTLKMEFDAGTQTRLLSFDRTKQPTGEKTWQGHSLAEWEGPSMGRRGAPAQAQFEIGGGSGAGPRPPGGGGEGLRGGPPPSSAIFQGGSLKVMTTYFREGYLRKNGVPYSENASITEYFHRLPTHPNGDVWLHVVTTVEDPKYLQQPFYTSTHFKLEPGGSKWNPTSCRTAPPPAPAK